MMRVERYARVGVGSAVDRPVLDLGPTNAGDITASVISAQWTDALDPPWHSLTLKMSGPIMRPPMSIGDHVVVRRAPSIPACAWCIVTELSMERMQSDSGRKDQGIWAVKALGWFDYLAKVDVVSALELLDSEAVGTVFGSITRDVTELPTVEQPLNPFSAMIRSINVPSPRDLAAPVRPQVPAPTVTSGGFIGLLEAQLGLAFGAGSSLAKFISVALRIAIPPGLQGTTDKNSSGLLRDCVRVVHNGATAVQFCGPGIADRAGAPARACEPIVGQNPSVQPLHNGSSKILGLIQGTWGADSGLTEMFPSLEDPGFGAPAPTGIAPDPVNQQFDPSSPALLPGPAKVLGRNPVLLYRMRPWRTEPLSQWLQKQRGGRADPSLPFLDPRNLKDVAVAALADYPTFDVVTWDLSRAAVISFDDLVSLSFSLTDDDAVTVITSQWAGTLTPDAYNGQVGLPIFNGLAAVYGARLYTVAWPFLRGTDAEGNEYKSSVTQQTAIMAAQAAQWLMLSERFASGTATIRPRGDVRPGEPMVIRFPEALAHFVCYVERVTQGAEIVETNRRETMSVTFSRGLWSENERSLPYIPPRAPFDAYPKGVA